VTAKGSLTKHENRRYEGELTPLHPRRHRVVIPIADTASPGQPRAIAGTSISAPGRSTPDRKEFVPLSISAPELGSRTPLANLGRARARPIRTLTP
jgi:hypothetical protein